MSKSKIQLLPDSVSNQIAAGEVVNRPASVVKEMLENAVDAGAKSITLNFRDGGKQLIQIIDDGDGMSAIDARLAFDKHATSKITKIDDIYSLHTFGFRGEALASIAAVSELELITKQQEDEIGTKVEISGGRFIAQSLVNTAVGSQFIVKNLLYNVPARRRFLDKSTTEARHIIAEFQRVALCNPEIEFTLYNNDALTSKLEPSTLRQRVINVIGKSIAKNLLDVEVQTSIVRVSGFVSRPEGAKQGNKEQFLFVNGRYFRNPYFHKAILTAYEKLIPQNSQPSYFIYLEIAPEQIDVNVHPQKIEVKFTDSSQIWQIINAAIRESLAKSGAVPSMDFDMDTSIEIPVYRQGERVYKEPVIRGNPDFNPFADDYQSRGEAPKYDEDNITIESSGWGSQGGYDDSLVEFISGRDDQRIEAELGFGFDAENIEVLPISSRYFATTTEHGLMIIDSIRASEAIVYQQLLDMVANRSNVSQKLLFSESIAMSTDDISLLKQSAEYFSEFGFEINIRDEHSVEISALPPNIPPSATEQIIFELLDAIREGYPDQEQRRRELTAIISHLGGRKMGSRARSREEMKLMVKQLSMSENPSFTASGKKIIHILSNWNIEEIFE